ncbi:MAG TPA: hypothetical protein VMH79_00525 [Thermoanaerobaculia bacterium]|nr:hypothetical protein [Thermoanaerobaculia bacterium]
MTLIALLELATSASPWFDEGLSIQALTAWVTSTSRKFISLAELIGTPDASVTPRAGIVAKVTAPSVQEPFTRRTSREPFAVTEAT